MCVCVCTQALGHREGGVMQVTWSVTHSIIHTGFYSQLHIVYTNVRAHTHTQTQNSSFSLPEPGKGALMDFKRHLM